MVRTVKTALMCVLLGAIAVAYLYLFGGGHGDRGIDFGEITLHSLFILLGQILLLTALAIPIGKFLERKLRIPLLVTAIFVGTICGPTGFMKVPEVALLFANRSAEDLRHGIEWIAVLLLMLAAGTGINPNVVWRNRSVVFSVGGFGVFFPFVLGSLAVIPLMDTYAGSPEMRWPFVFFMGLVISISAMVVIVWVFRDLGIMRSDLADKIFPSYGFNELLGFGIYSVLIAVIVGGANDVPALGAVFLMTLAFISFCLGISGWTSEWANRYGHHPLSSLTIRLVLGGVCGWITQSLGLTAVLGFFLAGMMSHRSSGDQEGIPGVTWLLGILIPLYFVEIGLAVNIAADFHFLLSFYIVAVAILLKYWGARIGAWLIPDRPFRLERHVIGIAFTASGVLGLIIAEIALEYSVIQKPMFVAIVCSVVVSALMIQPWLKSAIADLQSIGIYLDEILEASAVLAKHEASSREEVIEELCKRLEKPLQKPAAELSAAVLERESISSTAVGRGLAVPHAKIEGIRRPVLAVATLKTPISSTGWDSADDSDVQVVFLTVSAPDVYISVHLRLLSAISSMQEGLTETESSITLYQEVLRRLRDFERA
jgi:Kef-type K+ transport system membrane component KefB